MKNVSKELCLFKRRRNNDNKKQYLTSWYKLVPNNRLIIVVWVPRRHFSQKQSYLYKSFFLGFPLYLDLQVVMLTSLFVYFSTFSPSLTSLHCCYCWIPSPTRAVAHLKPSVYFNTNETFRFHPLDQTHVPGRGECWRSPCHVSPESAAIRRVLFNISADRHKYCIFIHKKRKGYFTALNRNSRGREVLVRFL